MLIIVVRLNQDVPRLQWRGGLSMYGCGRKYELPGVPISKVDKRIYGHRGTGVSKSRLEVPRPRPGNLSMVRGLRAAWSHPCPFEECDHTRLRIRPAKKGFQACLH